MLTNIASQGHNISHHLQHVPSLDKEINNGRRMSLWRGEMCTPKKKSSIDLLQGKVGKKKMIGIEERNEDEDLFINLNISGVSFQILKSIAERYPESLLAKLAVATETSDPSDFASLLNELDEYNILYLPKSREYFVQRSPLVFEIVLNFCSTGSLHCPPAVCQWMLAEELTYWRIGDVSASMCGCEHENDAFDPAFARTGADEANEAGDPVFPKTKWGDFKKRLWLICDKPNKSRAGVIFAILSVFFVTLAVIIEILRTMPQLRECHKLTTSNMSNFTLPPTSESFNSILMLLNNAPSHIGNSSNDNESEWQSQDNMERNSRATYYNYITFCDTGIFVLDAMEIGCVFWFTCELSIRFLAAHPRKKVCLASPINILDFLATAPWYIQMIASSASIDLRSSKYKLLFTILTFMRILRVLTILKIGRYVKAMRTFGQTVLRSSTELGLLLLFVAVNLVVFSSILYHLEHQEPGTEFSSIPACFWWCIATLTTTGYGDETPKTPLGRLVSGIACIVGILTMAFPVSILVESFNEVYKAKPPQPRQQQKAPETAVIAKLSVCQIPMAVTPILINRQSNGVTTNGNGTVGVDNNKHSNHVA